MSPPSRAQQPYNTDLEPALYADATVELQPTGDVYAVDLVELVPSVDTQSVTVSANSTNEAVEMTELYLPEGVLGQLRLVDPQSGDAIPSGVEIEVFHGGEESPRFSIKNQNGYIDLDTVSFGDNSQQTELYQWEDTDLYFDFTNTTGSDETFTLTYTGYAFKLSRVDVAPEDADIQVPTERLPLR
jgi:hypothetical protein